MHDECDHHHHHHHKYNNHNHLVACDDDRFQTFVDLSVTDVKRVAGWFTPVVREVAVPQNPFLCMAHRTLMTVFGSRVKNSI